MTKLPRGMSQLDYLWTNFGNYKVSEGIQSPPDPNSLITEKALVDAIKSINTVLYVYHRDKYIHPSYALEKLKHGKSYFDCIIEFYESELSKDE